MGGALRAARAEAAVASCHPEESASSGAGASARSRRVVPAASEPPLPTVPCSQRACAPRRRHRRSSRQGSPRAPHLATLGPRRHRRARAQVQGRRRGRAPWVRRPRARQHQSQPSHQWLHQRSSSSSNKESRPPLCRPPAPWPSCRWSPHRVRDLRRTRCQRRGPSVRESKWIRQGSEHVENKLRNVGCM